MLANHGDAISKKGFLMEAISSTVGALAIRIKVLGDHLDTVASYCALGQLMMRSAQFDRAAAFGRSALDVIDRLNEDKKDLSAKVGAERQDMKAEVLRLIDQAMYRTVSLAQGHSLSNSSFVYYALPETTQTTL